MKDKKMYIWEAINSILIIIIGALLLLGKKHFEKYVEEKGKNLATKEDIGEITDQVEKVKLEYVKESHRFQVISSGLLKKRAEAIEEIYQLIVDIEEIFGRFVSLIEWKDDPTKDEMRKEGGRILYDFLRKYKKNRIYFSEDVCDKLQSFSDSIYKATIQYSFAITVQIEGDHMKDFADQWVKANEDFKEKIPKARKIIEEEFRRLLGVEEI